MTSIFGFLRLCGLIVFGVSLPIAVCLAQSAGDMQSIDNAVTNTITGTVSNAVGSSITENVTFSQAHLQVTAPLLRFQRSAIDSGGNHLALRADDGSMRVWNLQRGNQGQPITGIGAEAVFAPSADGSLLILADASGKIDLRDTQSGKSLATFGGQPTPSQMMTTLDGQSILIGYGNGAAEFWSVTTQGKIWAAAVAKAAITAMSIDDKNGRAILGSSDGSLASLDLKTGKATPLAALAGPIALA